MPQGQRRFPSSARTNRVADQSTSQKTLHAVNQPALHHIYVSPAQAAAEYIVDMAEQLSLMARGQRLEMLAYLLDMARVEAEAVVSLQISVAQTPSSMPATPQRTDIQKHFEI